MKSRLLKNFLLIVLSLVLTQCSLDTKTGIWKNVNEINYERAKQFEGYEILYEKEKSFNKIIEPKINLKVSLNKIKTNLEWLDEHYSHSNNLENFSYKDTNNLVFISQKLTRYKIEDRVLFDGENAIITDNKGNIIVYSLINQKIVFQYNFYKKKYKKIKKKLIIQVNEKVLFVGDNLGFLYAIDYKSGKILWAKNYKIPFRSNLKITDGKLVIADINNRIYFINKKNGERIKFIPTEENIIKNEFISSIAVDKDKLFYLNTFGTLYSLRNDGGVNWFFNLNESLQTNLGRLFFSNPILISNNKLVILTNQHLHVLDKNSGFTIFKESISSKLKPIISGNNLFLITDDNLLVCINLINNKKKYSIKINQKIADFLETKSKPISLKAFTLLNDKLFIFLNNSYVIKVTSSGVINDIFKLNRKINSKPIYINESIVYIDNKNKLVIFD